MILSVTNLITDFPDGKSGILGNLNPGISGKCKSGTILKSIYYAPQEQDSLQLLSTIRSIETIAKADSVFNLSVLPFLSVIPLSVEPSSNVTKYSTFAYSPHAKKPIQYRYELSNTF